MDQLAQRIAQALQERLFIELEASGRHVHLTREDALALFGHPLTEKRPLSQPGQFVCNERVSLVTQRGHLDNVAVLGPKRKQSQVELSLTDARSIGVTAPVRESGDIAGSGACKLVGPCGEVEIREGVIAAKRHIHMTTAEAAAMGLKDRQEVSVRIPSANGRSLTFGDVVVRVSDKYALAMHIDTDESNAAGGVPTGTMGEILK